MPYWYEVFDDDEVQFQTRRQAALLSAFWAATLVCTLVGVVAAQASGVPNWATGLVTIGLWGLIIVYSGVRMRRLRRVVWCVKVSDRRVVGYDYMRRKIALDWTRVARVDLNQDGLVVRGPATSQLEVPSRFPDYSALSHRIVQYAEFYDVPIFINGQSWRQVDVYALFPFLGDDATKRTPPGASSSPAA